MAGPRYRGTAALAGSFLPIRDELERRAELAAGALERRFGGREITALEQQHGELDAAVGALQGLAYLGPAAIGQMHQHVLAAADELRVRRLHIDHEPVED